MKLISKFQRKGKLPIMSKEQFEKLQEEKTKVKSDNTRVAPKANITVDTQTKQANERIADEKARRNIQERDRQRRNQQNNVKLTPSTAQGRGELRENNLIEKAKADYGLKNGLGQMTPIADRYRHTASFGDFMGRSVPESMVSVGTFTAAPQTALFGLGTSLGGSYIGGKIGEQFGNKKAGQIIGSFVGPIAASGVNRAILPTVRKTFANEFGTSYGYDQLPRVPEFGKTLAKGGVKDYPKVVIDPETGDQTLLIVEKGKFRTYNDQLSRAEMSNRGRAQATAKYAGAPDEYTPFYLRNENGTYQYNMEESPYPILGLFNARKGRLSTEIARDNGKAVTPDFLGNNGGNVSLTHTGTFVKDGVPYERFMMRDVWDLQPAQKLGEKLSNKIIEKTQDKNKIIKKAGESVAEGIKKASKSKIVNREVGRIVGSKPFTLEHPFAIKQSLMNDPSIPAPYYRIRNNTINIFKNEKVPGATYSTPYEVGLDMPFDFSRIQKNIVYPFFNYEYIKNKTK